MKIIVCIKQVPSEGPYPYGMSSLDKHALEAALQLKDLDAGREVIALTMGPAQAEDVLLDAIAMGADYGVLLTDKTLKGADSLETAKALAAAVNKLGGADLILTGAMSDDGRTSHIAPQLAELLSLPQATYVKKLALKDGGIEVIRQTDDDVSEGIRLSLPCVISAAEALNRPRYMTMRGIRESGKAELPVWNIEDLGIHADTEEERNAAVKIEEIPAPVPERQGTILAGDTVSQKAKALIGELTKRQLR